MSPSAAPTLQARIALDNVERQVRRMGACFRDKKQAGDFVSAEVSALHWIAELTSALEKICAS